MKARAAWYAAALMFAVTAAWAVGQDTGFPHEEHEGVFPVCTGCHAGIETGEVAELYPDAEDCTTCHDGTTEELVDWTGPTDRVSNLAFEHIDHTEHVAESADSASCATCHQQEGGEGRMAVATARPETCLDCHAHEAPLHLAEAANCQQCHLPVTEVPALAVARIGAFPEPLTHEASDFVSNHAPTAPETQQSCSVCHALESCERCHLNGSSVPLIAGLPADDRIAQLVRGEPSEYPEPTTHEEADWTWRHGEAAKDEAQECANCHAQSSCRVCHQGAPVAAIAALPVAQPEGPPGVEFAAGPPVIHQAGFSTGHGAKAAASEQSCSGCHSRQSFCIDCHTGPVQPLFHGVNYREQHVAQSYGNETECFSCHNAEVFCRSCHAATGIASEGRLDVAFHTANPFWLLGHGQSARLRLENCTTCHSQSDCARCHSGVGAWRVNPHGPGFDGSRAEARNRFACLRCHRTDPSGLP